MRFTDASVRKLEPMPGTQLRYHEGDLYLTVGSRTKRFWTQARDPSGRQVQRTVGFFPGTGVAEARRKAIELREQIRGTAAEDPDITLRDSFSAYLERPGLSQSAIASYRSYGNRAAEVIGGGKKLRSVGEADLRKIRRELGHRYTLCYEVCKHVTRVWKWRAKSMGHRPGDAPNLLSDDLPKPEAEKQPTFRTRADFKVYFGIISQWRNRSLSRLLQTQCFTGYRISMVAGIRWEDVNVEQRYWQIRTGTKRKRPLLLPIPDPVSRLLVKPKESGWVFPSPRHHGQIRDYMQPFYEGSARLGYDVRSHSVRRFVIGELGAAGVDPNAARLLTGHVQTGDDVHGDIYVRNMLLDQLREPMAELAGRVADIVAGKEPGNNVRNIIAGDL